jgi:hypothetical protein
VGGLRWRLWAGKGGAHEWRTADPSAALGMTKKERVAVGKGRLLEERAIAGGKGDCWRKGRLLEERAVAQRRGLCQREWDAFSINNCPSPSTTAHLTIQTVAPDDKKERVAERERTVAKGQGGRRGGGDVDKQPLLRENQKKSQPLRMTTLLGSLQIQLWLDMWQARKI